MVALLTHTDPCRVCPFGHRLGAIGGVLDLLLLLAFVLPNVRLTGTFASVGRVGRAHGTFLGRTRSSLASFGSTAVSFHHFRSLHWIILVAHQVVSTHHRMRQIPRGDVPFVGSQVGLCEVSVQRLDARVQVC